MRHLNCLPIWRDANLLMLELEQAVRVFPRYHKYTEGSEIRATVLRVCQTIHRAAHSRRHSRVQLIQQLGELVDDLKMQLQLARELKAFQNYRQFQRVAELAVGLGKQSGGWLKQARAEAGRPKRAPPSVTRFHCAPAPPALVGRGCNTRSATVVGCWPGEEVSGQGPGFGRRRPTPIMPTTPGTSTSTTAMSTKTTRATTTGFGWFARDSEAAPYSDLRSVDRAWLACRRRKRATVRSCLYEQNLLDHLVSTRDALQAQTWQPSPPVVFTVEKPKAREVYAAQFEDRVVHHWLVPQLEAVIDRDFIHDAASNRVGRGTHFAVRCLQAFMRRRQGRGWLLQLDIANFFNSIHHPTLLNLLAAKLQKAVRRRGMPLEQARLCYRIAARIIRQSCAEQAIRLSSARSGHNPVPAHKRLENTPHETGLPIGNLTSQFFANLYLDQLDQFVKHHLKCRHYVRYVDDFVLLHREREQLEQWRDGLAAFFATELRLGLKEHSDPAPLGNGADFLGYIVRPGYRLVRRRVVGNLHDRLVAFDRKPGGSSGPFAPLPVQLSVLQRGRLPPGWPEKTGAAPDLAERGRWLVCFDSPKPQGENCMKLATGSAFVWLLAVVLFLLPLNSALAEVTCANQNSAVTATTPTADFTDNGDGTVTHNPTGLIWMRCSLGQSGSDCATGTAFTYTWQQALEVAQTINGNGGYAGHNDWRLPNKDELESIVERRCWSPAINAAIFPATPSAWFWSSSPYAGDALYAWYVGFNEGYVDYEGLGKGNDYRVRLVRAGQ